MVVGREVPKFYYLIVRMGMYEFTVFVGGIYYCLENKLLIKMKKRAAKGFITYPRSTIVFFMEDKCSY